MSLLKDAFLIYFYFMKKTSHIQSATGTYEDWPPPYSISKQKVRATKNCSKDKMTGRVDKLAHFREKCKKEKRREEISQIRMFSPD